ncbi:MAG: methyltransferase domain-containing protein [Nitrospirae bacterium]|nr:methyltransferase domain-containing protein [Nitrospirota bacterium]
MQPDLGRGRTSRASALVELGPGRNKAFPAAFGVDRKALPGIHVVADFRGGLPFRSDTIERIIAFSVVEHVPDAPRLIGECHRVLNRGGELWIKAPSPDSPNAWDDPTHVRPFTRGSFLYFVEGHEKNYYFDFSFSGFRDEMDPIARQSFWKWRWLSRCVATLRIPILRRAYQPIFVLIK